MIHVCLWGNAYSYIKVDKTGKIIALLPLNPANTQAYVNPNNGLLWYETVINSKSVELYADEVLHFKGMTEDAFNIPRGVASFLYNFALNLVAAD